MCVSPGRVSIGLLIKIKLFSSLAFDFGSRINCTKILLRLAQAALELFDFFNHPKVNVELPLAE